MEIRTASFVTSSTKLQQCPSDGKMEFAFIGRSNVGKSSLINYLLQRNGLAKTSQIPGKTQLINHFIANNSFYIVDLPGYGYAKTPKNIQKQISDIIDEYTHNRTELACLFILIDIRHEPLPIDVNFINDMGENGIPFALVFTKADKLSKGAARRNIDAYREKLLETWEELPPFFITSSEKLIGRAELLDYIDSILHHPEAK